MIRLQRVGKKNQAMFRLVLTEKQNGPKSGRFHELLGSYNPHKNLVQFDAERIKHWIGNGAQHSDTVHNLLVSEKIIEGKKRNVLGKKTPIVKEAEEGAEEVPKEESPATEEKSDEASVEEVKTEEAPKEEEKVEEKPEEPKEEKEEAPAEETKEEKKES